MNDNIQTQKTEEKGKYSATFARLSTVVALSLSAAILLIVAVSFMYSSTTVTEAGTSASSCPSGTQNATLSSKSVCCPNKYVKTETETVGSGKNERTVTTKTCVIPSDGCPSGTTQLTFADIIGVSPEDLEALLEGATNGFCCPTNELISVATPSSGKGKGKGKSSSGSKGVVKKIMESCTPLDRPEDPSCPPPPPPPPPPQPCEQGDPGCPPPPQPCEQGDPGCPEVECGTETCALEETNACGDTGYGEREVCDNGSVGVCIGTPTERPAVQCIGTTVCGEEFSGSLNCDGLCVSDDVTTVDNDCTPCEQGDPGCPPPPPPPPCVAQRNCQTGIYASPTFVARNATSTITWSSTETDSCTVKSSASNQEWVAKEKSVLILEKTTFTLECTGYNGSEVTPDPKSVTVRLAPRWQEI